uniref:Uncharacterized protein n=1 Tax=Heliothis virescens TaxID=7102 RepID=A0A2A4J4Z0_HELVI
MSGRGPGRGHVARAPHSCPALEVRTLRLRDGSVEVARVIVVSRGRHGKVVTERVLAWSCERARRSGGRRGATARPERACPARYAGHEIFSRAAVNRWHAGAPPPPSSPEPQATQPS